MTKQLTPLEALKTMNGYATGMTEYVDCDVEDCFKIIETALKALEIIKEKAIDVCYFMNCRTLEEYNDDVLASYAYEQDDAEWRMLTQKEFDLLKEVLNNDY